MTSNINCPVCKLELRSLKRHLVLRHGWRYTPDSPIVPQPVTTSRNDYSMTQLIAPHVPQKDLGKHIKSLYGEDYYRKMGKKGGQSGIGHKFAHGKITPHEAGKLGGIKSSRSGIKNIV
jgi:general stress protein YciG